MSNIFAAYAFITLPTGCRITVIVQQYVGERNVLFTINHANIHWTGTDLVAWAEEQTFQKEPHVRIECDHRVTIQMLARALQACACSINARVWHHTSTIHTRARHQYRSAFREPDKLANALRQFLPGDYLVISERPPDWPVP